MYGVRRVNSRYKLEERLQILLLVFWKLFDSILHRRVKYSYIKIPRLILFNFMYISKNIYYIKKFRFFSVVKLYISSNRSTSNGTWILMSLNSCKEVFRFNVEICVSITMYNFSSFHYASMFSLLLNVWNNCMCLNGRWASCVHETHLTLQQ
jgi:hypothetical protein